jgi:hypothetical protein
MSASPEESSLRNNSLPQGQRQARRERPEILKSTAKTHSGEMSAEDGETDDDFEDDFEDSDDSDDDE